MYQEVWDQKTTPKSQLPLPSRSPSLYEERFASMHVCASHV